MKDKRRLVLLIGALLLTAAAVIWDRSRGPVVPLSQAVTRSTPSSRATVTPDSALNSEVAINKIKSRSDYRAPGADAFSQLNLVAPSPVTISAPETPPTPTAPPLPFTVVGKKFEAGAWEIYLAKGEQTFIATLGATIADDYQVASIMPTQITLIYLPLNAKQTMPTGASLHE